MDSCEKTQCFPSDKHATWCTNIRRKNDSLIFFPKQIQQPLVRCLIQRCAVKHMRTLSMTSHYSGESRWSITTISTHRRPWCTTASRGYDAAQRQTAEPERRQRRWRQTGITAVSTVTGPCKPTPAQRVSAWAYGLHVLMAWRIACVLCSASGGIQYSALSGGYYGVRKQQAKININRLQNTSRRKIFHAWKSTTQRTHLHSDSKKTSDTSALLGLNTFTGCQLAMGWRSFIVHEPRLIVWIQIKFRKRATMSMCLSSGAQLSDRHYTLT